jgi:hypothetical protein
MSLTPKQQAYQDAAAEFGAELNKHMERVFAANGGRREGLFDPLKEPKHTPEYFAAANRRMEAYQAMVAEQAEFSKEATQ